MPSKASQAGLLFFMAGNASLLFPLTGNASLHTKTLCGVGQRYFFGKLTKTEQFDFLNSLAAGTPSSYGKTVCIHLQPLQFLLIVILLGHAKVCQYRPALFLLSSLMPNLNPTP
jgi:hypothetical protein